MTQGIYPRTRKNKINISLAKKEKFKDENYKKEYLLKNKGLFKKGEHKNVDTEFKKGYHGSHGFKKGMIPWNVGLTKETDERVKKYVDTRVKSYKEGKFKSWNKDLTKETDERVKEHSESMKGEKHHFWLDGKSFEPYGIEFNEELKDAIKKRDGYVCQECGRKEVLSVHHIDYDKLNNSIFNLISLCTSCHTKTNSNRKHWESYFKMKMFIKEFFNPENIKVFENKKLIVMERI